MNRALFCKDLMQNARPLLGLCASGLILPPAFALVSGNGKSAGYAGFVFGFLAISAPVMVAQWLIGQEKIKGTFRVLRLLPIPAQRIVAVKYIGGLSLCLLLLNTVLILEPWICRSAGIEIGQPAAIFLISANATASLLFGISVLLFTVFDARIAIQTAIWVLCGFMMLGYAARKYAGQEMPDTLQGNPGLFAGNVLPLAVLFIAVAGGSLLLIYLSARIFARKDWSELEDD